MGPFGSLQGHYIIHIDIASEVKSDLKFEISGSNYLLIHEHIAYMAWALLAAFWGHHNIKLWRPHLGGGGQ